MATQKCPKCKSDRVRQGYRPTPAIMKLFFRYHLLCDACNWEFTGFAIPGTIRKKTKKRSNAEKTSSDIEKSELNLKHKEENIVNEMLLTHEINKQMDLSETQTKKVKVKRKVKTKLFSL